MNTQSKTPTPVSIDKEVLEISPLTPFINLAKEVLDIKPLGQRIYEFNGAFITTDDLANLLKFSYKMEGYNLSSMEELYKALTDLLEVHCQTTKNAHLYTEVRNAKSALNNSKL
jgi:hypothetical protein